MNWIPIYGTFDVQKSGIVFRGKPTPYKDTTGQDRIGIAAGLLMNDLNFSGGEISATVQFQRINGDNACELVFYFDPARRWFVSAGLGGPMAMCFIRHWDGEWHPHNYSGEKENLVAGRKYDLKIVVLGSTLSLSIDGIEALRANIPFPFPPSQTGIHCLDDDDIRITNFRVNSQKGRAFIVMQFTSPFNEIYEEVIRDVCDEFEIDAHRSDETYGPGLIIADVTRDITESKLIIAEITPANPNVYYEIGYAHAIGKPTILLADKNIERLPFDISGFRVLFYENSIAGKRKFEEGLRQNIAAILQRDAISGRKPV